MLFIILLTTGCAALGMKDGGRMHMQEPTEYKQGECVVLLHGLARSSSSMDRLQEGFDLAGYKTVNIDYPSTELSIKDQVDQILAPIIQKSCDPENHRLHFVGHSLGGILSRTYLYRHPPKQKGSVVMIAPPNKGSNLVDRLGWIPVFGWINGPAGKELGTDDQSTPINLPEPDYPLLVIAGTKSTNPFYSMLIPGDDDGKVSVECAKVDGMTEFVTFHHTHTFIMNQPKVIQKAVSFVDETCAGKHM
jgi:hypothetical protein